MIASFVLLAVAVMSVSGGYLALHEPRNWKRTTSLVAAIASIASAGAFVRLVHVYNSRPLAIVTVTSNPLAGLGPWDLLALLLSFVAIVASGLGTKKARILLLIPSILMFSITLLALSSWD
jgi:hypothetical protein